MIYSDKIDTKPVMKTTIFVRVHAHLFRLFVFLYSWTFLFSRLWHNVLATYQEGFCNINIALKLTLNWNLTRSRFL